VDVWAIDEVHFEQHGSRCRMWVAAEDKDPILPHHPTRKKVGYFGAVRIRDGVLAMRREEDRFNAVTTWEFLKRLREKSKETGRKVIVIIDNARYHHAKLHKEWRALQEPDFVLEFLPPYSPKLNPIERVWKLTRRLCLHNRYFPTLDTVIQRVEAQFNAWSQPNAPLTSLCAII
jgi:transposase